jgi:hypothetical protein
MKQKSKGTEKGRNKENKNKVFVRKTNNYFSASLAVFLYYSSILSFFLSFLLSLLHIILLLWQNIRICYLVATVVRIRKQAFLKGQTENYRVFLYRFPEYGSFIAYNAFIRRDIP